MTTRVQSLPIQVLLSTQTFYVSGSTVPSVWSRSYDSRTKRSRAPTIMHRTVLSTGGIPGTGDRPGKGRESLRDDTQETKIRATDRENFVGTGGVFEEKEWE